MAGKNIQFFPLDIDYVTNSVGKGVIRLFGRTIKEEKICVLDDSFEPYFWVIPKSKTVVDEFRKKIEEIKVKEKDSLSFVTKTEIHEKKYMGNDVTAIKVFVNNPKDVPVIKDNVKIMDDTEAKKEIDIPFYRRYLIDKGMSPLVLCEVEGKEVDSKLSVDYVIESREIKQASEETIKKPKILAFDIEVYNVRRSPIEEEDPIIMVAFYGNDGYKKVVTWKSFPTAKDYIVFVDNEIELIHKFKEIIKEYKPDYLVGYFSDGFDFPYLRARAAKHDIKFDLGVDDSNLQLTRRRSVITAKIKGVVHLDIFKFIRNIMSGALQTDSYDLNSVAREIIKESKEEIKIEHLAEVWDKGGKRIEEFCDYNLQDANLTLKLCENILPNLNELVKLVGQPIFDVCRMSYGQLVEWYLIKQAKEFNEISPNRPTFDNIEKRRMMTYKGAFVFEPSPGLYKDVVVFDFKSLYPSIISAKNICPSTLTDDPDSAYETPEIEDTHGKKVRYYFSCKKEGFIPVIVRDLIVRRNRINEIIKKEEKANPILKARSYALKTVANSSYGYLGFFGSRWYSIECAASITAFGREYIQKLIDKAMEKGFKVIYGDTDGVFLALEKKTKKDALDFLKEFNRELPSLMELELEDFYPTGIFVMRRGEIKGAKKKYAMINEEGEIKVRGFETVRRDWSYVAKETQNKVLEIILKEKNKKKAFDYLAGVISKVRNKEFPLDLMIIQTQLKKDIEDYEQIGPHVAVAQKMRRNKQFVGPGLIIRYVITEGKGMIRDRAKLPEECKDKEYDAEYYVNNQLIPAVVRIFEVLGYKKEDLLDSKGQSKLGSFY